MILDGQSVYVDGDLLVYPRAYEPLMDWMRSMNINPNHTRAGDIRIVAGCAFFDAIPVGLDGTSFLSGDEPDDIASARIRIDKAPPLPAVPDA